MKITSEQHREVIKKLSTYTSSLQCEICGKEDWVVSDLIFQAPEYNQGGYLAMGGKSMPLLPIICENCGNSKFINAIKLGLTKLPGESKEKGGRNNRRPIEDKAESDNDD